MTHHLRLLLPLIAVATLPASDTLAATVPFVENFDVGAANWMNGAYQPLTHNEAAGPNGVSYVSANFNFADIAPEVFEEDTPSKVIVRGEPLDPPIGPTQLPSDGAFFGNWLGDGVAEFRLNVRHNAPQPLSLYARFAIPARFPGVIAPIAQPVQPGEWTELVVPMDFALSGWLFEGPPSPATLSSVLSNVGHIQLAAFVPENLAGLSDVYTLDIDSIGIFPVPEPSGLISLSLLALTLVATRRLWRSAVV